MRRRIFHPSNDRQQSRQWIRQKRAADLHSFDGSDADLFRAYALENRHAIARYFSVPR
jgi:hypothetical protein